MRIPITMCHGTNPKGGTAERPMPLDAGRFDRYFSIARELGFESISYDDLAAWRADEGALPEKPIMFDFDHAVKSMYHEVAPIMQRYGYAGNLFIHTAPVMAMYEKGVPPDDERTEMTWEESAALLDMGWHIGAHTHTHPNLSQLSLDDPSGEQLRRELETCDDILKKELGITPKDFAFTGTSWSRTAEDEVAKRYRFGRLWIIGSTYQADGNRIRYADLAGVSGPDEGDGGPPEAARYITEHTHPYRLPSMEIQGLIYTFDAFRAYLEGAAGN